MEVTLTLLLISASSLIVFLVLWALQRKEKHKLFKKLGIPGPEPRFFTGNLFHMKGATTPNDAISKWLKKYGDVFGYFLGEVPYIVIKDLEMLKQVFIKDFQIFADRPETPLKASFKDEHLAHMAGKRWKELRSILTPTFTSGKIKLMTEIVGHKVDSTLSLVRKKSQNNEMFDMYKVVQALTLDVIADCAFAMKTNCQQNENDTFLIAARDFFLYKSNPAILLTIMFPFLSPLMGVVNDYLTATGRAVSLIFDHLKVVINARRKNLDFKSNDFLQMVLDNNKNVSESKIKMTDVEIMANAFLFLLAGYETTATALGFTFYLLIKHPEVQEKLYREISDAEDFSYNTIQNLHYLDQVLNESLRCYPPITGFISRSCSQDHQVGSIMVPKGTKVLAPVWDIHHDPDLWPDPWTFDPERFSPENKTSIPSMAYLPFGAGPRNCIGARFAQLEAKLALFKLVKEFRFETCEKTDDPLTLRCSTVITNPAKGVYLRAVPRTKSI